MNNDVPIKERFKYLIAYLWEKSQDVRFNIRELTNFISNQVPILNYHSVISASNSNIFASCVTTDNFEQQIKYLTSNYEVISLKDHIEYMKCTVRRQSSANYAVVTFDDGNKNNYTNAYPILKKYGCPATIFIPTAFIEGQVELVENGEKLIPLTWFEIQRMKDEELMTDAENSRRDDDV